jgi:glycosyltransferase involved in cell wall biosynthesis
MSKLLMVATVTSVFTEFLLPFTHYFRGQGWLVDGMASEISACPECLDSFDRVWDAEFSRNPLELHNLFLASQRIQEVMAKRQYDIVHVHTPIASFITRYTLNNLRKHTRTKVIYTAHGFHFHPGGNPLKNMVFMNLEKLAGAWTDYLIVINRDDEQLAKLHQILPPERLRYMPGIGVDLNHYNRKNVSDADVVRVRYELGLLPTNPLFLAIAEFTPNKRHKDMVRALARLRRPGTHLAIAGEGPKTLMDETRKLATELGVQDRVHFLGYRRDIPTLICASVATLLVSAREGLPRSVMESLCLETPVIGTDIRGIRDLLAGDCGLLIQVGDIEGLTAAMTWMLDHPEEAQNMGKRGKKSMADYDLQHIVRLHEALYVEAMQEVSKPG